MNRDIESHVRDILSGPKGPAIGAFFDFDGTLIDGFSAAAYVRQRLRRGEIGLREFSELLTFTLMDKPADIDFLELISNSVHRWKGMSESDLAELWMKLFANEVAPLQYPEAWEIVQAHKRMGHTLAIASSATHYQVAPAAREFDIAHILCTPIEIRDGTVTGRLAGAPLWDRGKADALQVFGSEHGIRMAESYAYANGDEDVPFLSAVGRPMAVNSQPRLRETARHEGWPVVDFHQRRRTTIESRVRTTASYAAMGMTFLGGLAATAAGMPQRRAVNLVSSVAAEIGLAIAGVKLNVQGEENLWKARPAVFLFNHQSPLDLIINTQLLRRDATGVVKKEAGDLLGWGHFMRFADMAFVDRHDSQAAYAALEPAIEKLRSGISVGVAPEGTRSYSPRLGPFKKGAFRMAMAAGVPLVPVVVRNAGEVMHRDSAWIRPGEVDVCVLPPIPVDDWTEANLQHNIEAVHRQFEETLAAWPGTSTAKAEKESTQAVGSTRRKSPAPRSAGGTSSATASAESSKPRSKLASKTSSQNQSQATPRSASKPGFGPSSKVGTKSRSKKRS